MGTQHLKDIASPPLYNGYLSAVIQDNTHDLQHD